LIVILNCAAESGEQGGLEIVHLRIMGPVPVR